MQTTAIRTVANSLPQNEEIFLTFLVSGKYISYTDLQKQFVTVTLENVEEKPDEPYR